MLDHTAIRSTCLLVPCALTIGLWIIRRPLPRQRAGVMLACLWNLPVVAAVNSIAAHHNWWTFDATGAVFMGTPFDLELGWILLWGAVPVLVFARLNLLVVTALFLFLDLLLMPLCAPVVQLGPQWLTGEALALAVGFVPAQLLARWTARSECLVGRVVLQMLCFSALMLWLIPAAIMQLTDTDFAPLLERDLWKNTLALQLLALPAIIGLSAVQEFARSGAGTPIPFDPPRRLVTTGVYAYLRNPMQTSMLLLMGGWGLVLLNPWVACCGAMIWVYGVGFSSWYEAQEMQERFGDAWLEYRNRVRRWLPCWRPSHSESEGSARLYYAESCSACRQVRAWLERRHPRALKFCPAEHHPSRTLTRLTYETGQDDSGMPEQGVVAFARALEHIHFGWSFIGFAIRLPIIRRLTQLLCDVVGGGPRQISGTSL